MNVAKPTSDLRVGTSGFSFEDWVGPVYPKGLAKNRMLEYYEQELGFDTVELNFTYYALPVPRTLDAMVKRTGDDFRFVVRSHKDMTHDIWTDEKRRTLKDTADVFKSFREGVSPLVDSGRLGCVLVQMPSFFWPIPENFRYVRRFPELLPGVALVVEFRNRAWVRDTAFRMLEEAGMGYCVVDEPKLPRLMPFDPRRTSDVAYFRFHGRNRNWFKASREERYNYLYSKEELEELAGPVRRMAEGTGLGGAGGAGTQTFVFFNNCHAGAAARNALLMKQMLGLAAELSPVQSRVVEGE